ncbi:Spy/CpxP family protein refolding chaperone [Rugamonas aquatica]|uniref:LTXXQ motif family protein n=1 Tax=Rugamonas aquatica TaxID=2743357 RepID=A0A6A7N8Z5_9BURK|nr:Spy/CpxP family protein refolding chaperone [Rugamonas aquatica]MQA41519.1 hypothetical protein [Rugamonas aquatica]
MNILRKSILIGFTVLGMAAAQAQDMAPAAGRHGAVVNREQMQAKMEEMFAKRQAKLHDLLKLTTQQESAWATYQAAIKPTAAGGTLPDRDAVAKMSAPDRLAKMIDLSKQRQAKMEAHLTALTAFYSQLTAEQKAIFDDHTRGGAHGGHPGQRGGWGGHKG